MFATRLFLVAGCLGAAVACREAPLVVGSSAEQSVPVPEDRGEFCADVGDVRACWGGAHDAECRGGVCRVARPLPPGVPPPEGWRCGDIGSTRVCADRRRNGGPFRCEASSRCVQREPRMPDDGEWECVEMAGVVFCHDLGAAAGIAPGPADLGWQCGERRGVARGERICIDLAPDRPSPGDAWRCTFDHRTGKAERICLRDEAAQVGSRCGDACPTGAACVGGYCLPARPLAACWLDGDCGGGQRCRWGTCTRGGS